MEEQKWSSVSANIRWAYEIGFCFFKLNKKSQQVRLKSFVPQKFREIEVARKNKTGKI